MKRPGAILLRSVILFVMIEAVLWGLAALQLISLPSVIPLADFDQAIERVNSGASQRLYELDRWRLTTLRRNAVISYPRHPISAHSAETYTVRTNSAGMRNAEVTYAKPAGLLRIACLGDSSTFGFNVEADDAYPHQLQELLDADYPGRFQVLNFGVPGYASLQGVEHLKHSVLDFHPDVVTFAFGTNDRFWHGPASLSERLRASQSWSGTVSFELRRILNLSATYRALRMLLFHAGALHLDATQPTEQKAGGVVTAVQLEEMENAIAAAGSLAAHAGAAAVVLNIDLNETDAVKASTEGAQRAGLPFVDIVEHLAKRQREYESDLASKHGVAPTTLADRTQKFVFRVIVDGHPKQVSMRHRPFFKTDYTIEALYDDGTHGDEHSGDGVWSLATDYTPGTKVIYSYFSDNGDGKLVREFTDSFVRNGFPMLGSPERGLVLEVGAAHVDVYGTMYLRADHAHPNEEGHGLIAAQVRDAILALPLVRKALGQP